MAQAEVVEEGQPGRCPNCGESDQLYTVEQVLGHAPVEVVREEDGELDISHSGDTSMFWDTSESVGIGCSSCDWETGPEPPAGLYEALRFEDPPLAELAESWGLDPANLSVEDTIAQRDALEGAIADIARSRAEGGDVDVAIRKAGELCAVINRILNGEGEGSE